MQYSNAVHLKCDSIVVCKYFHAAETQSLQMLFPRCKKTSLFDRRPNKSLIIMFLLENATQKKSHLAPIVSQNVQGGLEYSG